MMKQKPAKQKRNFSSFSIDDAFREVAVEIVLEWQIKFEPIAPSDFFVEKMRRMQRFDTKRSEDAKKLIIDAFFEEALQPFPLLRMWKSVSLSSDTLTGVVDYFVTRDVDILTAPYLCVVEAKKDDFEQGLAQCLVEMKAAQWLNEQIDMHIDVFGIVSNGGVWQFYKMTAQNQVFGTKEYAAIDEKTVLGMLDAILSECAGYVEADEIEK